ncbi:MAG TPA: hypothetical protein PKM79_04050 [Smithellaceae bacterium]|jgi:hypothetical protein|nr:hypothetical protein [Smithellaceae bacterium]HNV65477.1 hypothetical protein [Smithellaceae bacterium]HOD30779.1 hypothetical protein [Smithellaceae bacterium]HQB93165.1 hypothetical protein [Smithellaceae bacterium]HQO13754.1 hypothetical protein [Smithellaceae bacterium]
MTHLDKGKYYEKHPKNSRVDESLKEAIFAQAKDNNIACKKAEGIAGEKRVAIAEVGKAIDILNINIIECQLGLFGYGDKKKIVQPAKEIATELKTKIEQSLRNGKLSCVSAWKIAAELSIPRMRVCAACEALKIKVKPCQLGAF